MAEIQNINEKTVEDLFFPCRECVYWEAPTKCGDITGDEAFAIKRKWFSQTQKTFGECGKLLYINGDPRGYAQYCPSNHLENAREYSHFIPVSWDALLLSCLYVKEGSRKKGIGTLILAAVIDELKERGYHAVETYSRDDSSNNCSGPTDFYLKNGFTVLKTKKWGSVPFSLVRREF